MSRVGHVFQGRYKAILVERDAYLRELARYVVLNPVRAGMVSLPGEWPWSSWVAMMEQSPVPEWLETRWLLQQFSQAGNAREGNEIPRMQRRPIAKPLAHYSEKHADRDAAVCAAFLTGDYTQAQIAEHFGVHYSTISRIVRFGKRK